MTTITPEQQQNAVSALYIALFNRAPDAAGFQFWVDGLAGGATLPATINAFLASPEARAIYTVEQTPEQFVAAFYETVFGRDADAGGLVYWTNVLNTAAINDPETAKAVLVTLITETVSTPLPVKPEGLSDELYAQTVADRELFGKKVVAGLGYAVDEQGNDLDAAKKVIADLTAPTAPEPGPTPSPGPVTPPAPAPGETFVLVPGADNLVGTARNDTFNAGLTDDGKQTLHLGASLDGGAGTDTLFATLNESLNSSGVFTPKLKNIEVIKVTALANADNIFNLNNSSGFTHVGSDKSGIALTFSGVGNAALSVSNQTQNVAFQGSTATTLSLTLDKVGTQSTPISVILSGGGWPDPTVQATKHDIVATDANVRLGYSTASKAVTTVTVTAEGTNSLTLAGADAATVTNLTVTGKGSVDFSDRALSALTTFTAGDGGVTLISDNATANALTIKSGAGADTITANAASIKSLQTGAGNDVVELLGTALSSTATVDLGEGDDSLWMDQLPTSGNRINGGAGRDTLIVNDASFDTAAINSVKNFEVLAIDSHASTFDLDVSTITAMSEFWLSSPGTTRFTNATNTTKFEIASNAQAVEIANASGQAQTDVTLTNRNMGVVDLTIDSLNLTGVTTLSLTSNSAGSTGENVITKLVNSDNSTITVEGDADLRFALAATAEGSTVDASTFTGKLNVTGSDFDDVITGTAGSDVINGGDGDDIIDGGAFTTAEVTAVTETVVVTWQGFQASGLQSGAAQSAGGLFINVDQYKTSDAISAVDVAAFVNGGGFDASETLTLSGPTGDQVGNWKFAAGDVPGTTVFTSITPDTNVPDITSSGFHTVGNIAPVVEITQGSAAGAATNGSVDTLTGGGGADTFVFGTPDAASTAGAVTAIITDFEVGTDRILVRGGGFASAETLVRAVQPTDDLAELLSAANTSLNGTVKYFLGELVDADGASTYLVTDNDGIGYTNVIKLTGVALNEFQEADLMAPV